VLHIKTELGNRKISEPGQESPDLTNERKIMSTKTLRKRIALVAVSAMGFGLLSAVNAQAAFTAADTAYLGTTASTTGAWVSTATDETTIKSVGLVSYSASSVSDGTTKTANALPGATLAFGFKATDSVTAVVSGGTIASSPVNGVVSSDLTTFASTAASTGTTIGVVPSSVVGAVTTVKFYKGASLSLTSPANGTLVGVYAITTVSASVSGVISAAKSTVAVDDAAGAQTVDQADGFSFGNGATGYIYATYKDAYSSAITSGTHYIQVSATNGAFVGFSAYPTASSAVSTDITQKQFYVTQGVANKAVSTEVTITVDGVVLAKKAMTFAGELSKITATVLGITKKDTTAREIVSFKAYDAAGNRVPATAALYGTNAVITGSVETQTTATVTGYLQLTGNDYGTNSGLYIAAANASGATIVSNIFAVSSAGDAYTYKATLDKKEYNMGDIATLTVSFFDVYGKPANDITAVGTSTLKPAIAGGVMTAVNAPLYTDVTADGVITYQYIVGNTSGTYSLAVDFPLLTSASGNASDTTKTIGYTVKGDGSVSNAEVLAAIVKLIASINKQIAALQKALTKKK